MGTESFKCQCACNKDDKTEHFEQSNPISPPIQKNENNIYNDNMFSNNENGGLNPFQGGSENVSPEHKNLRNFVKSKGNLVDLTTPSFPNKGSGNYTSSSTKNEAAIDNYSIIHIQSVFRGYFYRKIYPSIQQELIEKTNQLIKELTEQYTKFNLKRAESLYGIKFDKNGWKSLKGIGGENIEDNSKFLTFDYGTIYDCKILALSMPIPSIYTGKVNIDYQRHEYGVLLLNDGSKYEGYWRENYFTGWGRYIDSDGTIFEGNFQNGRLNGKGIKRSLNGNMYIGDFVESRREGKGREETNEHIYEGEFKNDKKNGTGKLSYKLLKDTYEGEFLDNCITGIGFYTWGNKDTYKGSFVNGKMHGKGLYKWPGGGEYYGDYVNNIKEGSGTFKWPNGKVYEGQFKKGRPSGFGKLKTGGKIVNVQFEDGKLLTNLKEVMEVQN